MPSVTSFVSKSYLTLSQFLLVWFPNPLAAARQMGTLSWVLPTDILEKEGELGSLTLPADTDLKGLQGDH